MCNYQTLSFPDISSNASHQSLTRQDDFIVQKIEDKSWGSIGVKVLEHPHVNIIQYKADLNNNYQLQFDEQRMLQSMNVCMVLQGDVGLSFEGSQFTTGLSSLQHHHIHAAETAYSLWIQRHLQVVHLAIDLDYYIDLLDESDRGTASMKDKLLNRELVCSNDGRVGAAMQQAIHSMLNNSLTGNLKNILVEGKVLEIVALQLSELTHQQKAESSMLKMRAADVDVFHDLRKYLDQHFANDLSLKGLSRMFGLNEFKLKKGFKQLFNTTVFDYIQERKMNYSKQLLCDQGMYVNEVARKVGYKNPNHFSTAFKRQFGVNPTALK